MTKYCQSFSDNFKAPQKKIFIKLGKPMLVGFLFVMVFSSLAIYLFEVNAISTKGFKTRDLENQIEVIKNENEKLSLQIIEMQSMGQLKKRVAGLGMVAATDVVYYSTATEAVARR